MSTPTIGEATRPIFEQLRVSERSAPFQLTRADEGVDGENDGRTLDGYAAVFNQTTIIDSWEGRFKEKLSPGSMKKSFRERPPRIQFDHGRHPLIGSIPIAVPEDGYPREETHSELAPEGGAHIVGRLHDNWLIEPVREAVASGSIDGMSFRFQVLREMWFDEDGKQIRDEEKLRELLRRSWFEDVPDDELILRDLREMRVPELGPVVWPAYEGTTVGVRARELASEIRSDAQLTRVVCRGLAYREVGRIDDMLDRIGHHEIVEGLKDPETCREVALALLFDPDAPPDGHPSTDEPRQKAGLSHVPDAPPETGHLDGNDQQERSEDAPPDRHPSEDADAPPTVGHPSMSRSRMSAELARLNGRVDVAQRYIDNDERRRPHDE